MIKHTFQCDVTGMTAPPVPDTQIERDDEDDETPIPPLGWLAITVSRVSKNTELADAQRDYDAAIATFKKRAVDQKLPADEVRAALAQMQAERPEGAPYVLVTEEYHVCPTVAERVLRTLAKEAPRG